jgi:hypothetical protein
MILVLLRFIYLCFEKTVIYYSELFHKSFTNNKNTTTETKTKKTPVNPASQKIDLLSLSYNLNKNSAENPTLEKEKLLYV